MTKRLILIVSILFTVITTAQERTSSPYSFYGIGLTTFKGTAENQSMGGLSIYSDSIHLNLQNPASYGKRRLTTYTIGASHSELTFQNSESKETTSVTTVDYLAVGIPAGKFGFGFGLIPYTSVGYNIQNVNEEMGVVNRYSGRGGLNKVFLSAGYEIMKDLNIGVNANYNFGNIQNKNINLRRDVQYATREINRSDLSGLNFNFGVNYQTMINDNLEWTASAVYELESNLNSENTRSLATIIFVEDDREVIADGGIRDIPLADSEFTLPTTYSVGTGIGKPRKWFLGAEYSNSEASSFSNRSFSPEGATYSNSSKYKLGGFYIPNYNSLTSYFNRIVYRAGLRMEETGLNLHGEAINEFGISFGVGLPAGRLFSNANLGFEYGQRGTTDSGLIQENFFRAVISLSLNDRWFVQRKFE